MDHKGVLIAHQWPVPQCGAQGVDGDDIAPGVPQFAEQGKLLGGEGGLRPVSADCALAPVDLRVPQPGGLGLLPVHPPEHRVQAEQQLLREKRLGDVVVRTQAQALQPVGVLVPGGEEQYRHVPVFPEFP